MLECREVRTDFDCSKCYEITIANCDEIIIDGQLNSNTSYYLVLFDQFDIKRIIGITTDDIGIFEINKSLLPDNYFNPFGVYDFYISTDSNGTINAPLILDGTEYTCIILTIE